MGNGAIRVLDGIAPAIDIVFRYRSPIDTPARQFPFEQIECSWLHVVPVDRDSVEQIFEIGFPHVFRDFFKIQVHSAGLSC